MDIIVNKKKQIRLVIVSNNILKIKLLPKWISKQTTEHFQESSWKQSVFQSGALRNYSRKIKTPLIYFW